MNKRQQRYQVFINKVDVTRFVLGEVSLLYNVDTISELSFTLATVDDILANVISPGTSITFYGGASLETNDNYSKLFEGVIKKINPSYMSSGSVHLGIIAYDLSYSLVKTVDSYIYPDKSKKRNRTWAYGDTIRASDIFRNLIKENGFEIALDENGQEDIKLLVDKVFTYKNPLTQNQESEWGLLRKLASSLNCQVWATFEGEKYNLHIVDRSFLMGANPSNLIFVNPERTYEGGFTNPKFAKNNIPIWDIKIEQDYSQMFSISQAYTVFDYDKGEDINIWSAKFIENNKEVLKFFSFEIDEAKAKGYTNKEIEDFKSMILNKGGANGRYSDEQMRRISDVFVPAKYYSEKHFKSVDVPYYGLTLTCTCEGNIYIVPKKNYNVEGLGRYSTKNLSGGYYLRKLTHTWGDKGFLSKLELVR